jgi:hypothetical protein
MNMERLNLHMKKQVVPSRTINKMVDLYDPTDDLCASKRHGANDALRLPSRIGNKLFYRDGMVAYIGEMK